MKKLLDEKSIEMNDEGALPLVSVITPTYKRSNMLSRAIDSVLNQTYENIQIVIVDDNDPYTDWRKKTQELMLTYEENPKIKYIRHDKNKNGAVARNTGIYHADGDIVCFLDDDDWFLPDKVEKQVKYLLQNTENRAVYCGWDRDGIVIPKKHGNMSFELLSGTNLIYTNVIMMWRHDAIECGGWDENLKRHQEAGFLLRYFKNGGKIGVISECLVKFDTSDRSNAASNGNINEEHMKQYLDSYKDMIEACEAEQRGAKKNIYSYRYRGVLLEYLKFHDIKGAFRLYCKIVKQMPVKFNMDLIRYFFDYLVNN
ncbi:MAG: glycosyltransferase family 2 protein [Lachnospiraceae bacterium]|nr:glycosyltransferase family 2 protein [Lachnospiraceae bacterium]